MEHLTLKAVAAATTDEGLFQAVISTEAVDREKDIVSADAMVKALRKWNRAVPLAWNHSTVAEDIFGHIHPQTAQNVNGEVVVDGEVDLASKVGKEAWRSFKSGAIGFSFGYMILQAANRKGGGRNITELDVFEVTATPTPMNNDTRVLSTKGAVEDEEQVDLAKELQEVKGRLKALEDLVKDADETDKNQPEAGPVDPLRGSAQKAALDILSGGLSAMPPLIEQAPEPAKRDPEMDPDALRKSSRDLMLQVLSGVDE